MFLTIVFYLHTYPICSWECYPKDVLVVFGMVVIGTNPLLGVSKDGWIFGGFCAARFFWTWTDLQSPSSKK